MGADEPLPPELKVIQEQAELAREIEQTRHDRDNWQRQFLIPRWAAFDSVTSLVMTDEWPISEVLRVLG
jgi:hypothetical protein